MKTIVDEVYAWIKQKLAKGDFSAGQRVSQRKLAREFGCSPMPVAEVMRRLESDGLLIKEPLKIPRIRQISPKDMEGLYLVREGLEGVAARLCAQRISEADLVKLNRLGREFEKAVLGKDLVRSSELDMEIHRFITRGAECPLLLEEIERLLLLEMTAGGREKVEPKALIQRHKALIQAISDRDGDFAEYMAKRHVHSGYQELVDKKLTSKRSKRKK
jgi:DNA-binding GntR family transcriptional regulator